MAQLSSPAEKTELALFLLSQMSSGPIPDAQSSHKWMAPSILDASDVSVSPAGQAASAGGLPVVVVLHAAARMALSAARGVVMMPLPGVNELNEVVGLRVSGVVDQCLRSRCVRAFFTPFFNAEPLNVGPRTSSESTVKPVQISRQMF